MTLELQTLDKDVRIVSVSDGYKGIHTLNFYNENWPEFKRSVTWKDAEYGTLLHSLWITYARCPENVPQLSGYGLGELEFVCETLHYVFPGWLKERGEFTDSRRDLVTWLACSASRLEDHLDKRNFSLLYEGLDKGLTTLEDKSI